MKFEPTNLKGTSDFEPAVQVLRNRVTDSLRKNFQAHGFMPLETTMLNHLDLLTHKYDDNAEIVREIYKLRDQGDRDLGLRFDLTVPFCKYIAMNRNLKMPFARYEIGKVWRNGPVKAGRLREFYQCDIDVVGIPGATIEAEIMALAIKCLKDLGIDPVIKYGNRKLLTQLIAGAGVAPSDTDKVIGIIDRMEKVSREELIKDLTAHMAKGQALTLLESFDNPPLINEVCDLQVALKHLGIEKHTRFTPSLARGLNYYTGTIFEGYDKSGNYKSSLCGGGRYDNIITDFISNGVNYPAIGISFGLEPIMAVLSNDEQQPNPVNLLVVPMNTVAESYAMAEKLRAKGKTVQMWHAGKVGKALEYANATNIPYTCVIGERELESQTITIKRMHDGAQQEFAMKDVVAMTKFLT